MLQSQAGLLRKSHVQTRIEQTVNLEMAEPGPKATRKGETGSSPRTCSVEARFSDTLALPLGSRSCARQYFGIEFVSETWSVVEEDMSILNCRLVKKHRLSSTCVDIPVLSHWRVRRGHLEVIS